MNLYALHGFLGRPEDWGILDGVPHCAVDLFRDPICSLEEWGPRFNASVQTDSNVLMGYSLGARLALHALVDDPSKWKAAVIIAGHSGFDNEAERKKRGERDDGLALKFASEPWPALMQRWEALPVFSHAQNVFRREERQFSRAALSGALTHWSMSKQKNLKPLVEKLNIPILWIAGENDSDYRKHAESLHFFHPKSRLWIAPNSGHRVPWETPSEFLTHLQEFLC